jgi:hypothetical protein
MLEGKRNSLSGCEEGRIHGTSSDGSSVVIFCYLLATKLLLLFVAYSGAIGRGMRKRSSSGPECCIPPNWEGGGHMLGRKICLHIISYARMYNSYTIRNIHFA